MTPTPPTGFAFGPAVYRNDHLVARLGRSGKIRTWRRWNRQLPRWALAIALSAVLWLADVARIAAIRIVEPVE